MFKKSDFFNLSAGRDARGKCLIIWNNQSSKHERLGKNLFMKLPNDFKFSIGTNDGAIEYQVCEFGREIKVMK